MSVFCLNGYAGVFLRRRYTRDYNTFLLHGKEKQAIISEIFTTIKIMRYLYEITAAYERHKKSRG